MILHKGNCSNPAFYGKNIKFVIDGKVIDSPELKVSIPSELDFVKEIYPKDPQGAKEYYSLSKRLNSF